MSRILVIITGASSGIGQALVQQLANDPIFPVLISRRPTQELLDPHKQGLALQIDLSDTSRLENHWMNKVASVLPGVFTRAVLVNNAGMVEPVGPVGTLDSFELERSLALNLVAPLLLDNLFLRDIQCADRRIIHVSSGAALHAYGGWSAYCSSKAGMKMLSDTITLESSEYQTGVQSISFAPGIVATPMQEVLREVPEERFKQVERFIGFHQNGQLLEPEVPARRLREFILDNAFPSDTFLDIRDS